ncbi:MAG: hypothetical protein DRP38_02075 [Thermotogae bacterium]|nr:MAG: hypothetical protein DRP38_02075 [Thermotogota bacterium]
MAPWHLLLGHVVADHAFANNEKIRKYKGLKLFGHIVWSFFAILAFCFDTIFNSLKGIVIFISFFVLHAVIDILRVKYSKRRRIVDILELIALSGAFFGNLMIFDLLKSSYLSPEFVYYLLGMSVVSVGVTYIFRNFYPGVPEMSDIEGISERLAFFVFMLAGKFLFAFLSLVLGFLYRLWRIKKFDPTWWMSPSLGVVISTVWYISLYH